MKFGIGIPTLNRYDLLMPNLKTYARDFPNHKIYILDNGKQNIAIEQNIELIEKETNIGVGASWNVLCEKIFETSDYALILNDDIYLGKSQQIIESVIERISKKGDMFATATPDWCAFILPKSVWKSVGKFDECFYPAYYEDNSFAYRLKLKGLVHYKTPLLNPLLYRTSQTLEKDYSILEKRKKNKELYIKMWGGEPTKEKFTTPYNGKINN